MDGISSWKNYLAANFVTRVANLTSSIHKHGGLINVKLILYKQFYAFNINFWTHVTWSTTSALTALRVEWHRLVNNLFFLLTNQVKLFQALIIDIHKGLYWRSNNASHYYFPLFSLKRALCSHFTSSKHTTKSEERLTNSEKPNYRDHLNAALGSALNIAVFHIRNSPPQKIANRKFIL